VRLRPFEEAALRAVLPLEDLRHPWRAFHEVGLDAVRSDSLKRDEPP